MIDDTKFTGRLFGYMRVSTDDQDFALQRKALLDYGVPSDHIFSEKTSGVSTQRKGLERAIKVCDPGDALVVWKLDRLGRSLVGVVEQLEALIRVDIKVVVLTSKLDYTSPEGRMMAHMTAVFAQFERDIISERTKAGIAAYQANGGVMGQPHPILDRPNRKAKFKELFDSEAVYHMTGQQIVDVLNSVEEIESRGKRKGKPVKPMSLASWSNTKQRVMSVFLPRDEPIGA